MYVWLIADKLELKLKNKKIQNIFLIHVLFVFGPGYLKYLLHNIYE